MSDLSRRDAAKRIARFGAVLAAGGLVGPRASALAQGDPVLAGRPLVRYPEKTDLILLTSRPPQLETPMKYFDRAITPNDAFFVRYHVFPIPLEVDLATWRLRVTGRVDRALELSYDDLKTRFPRAGIVVDVFLTPIGCTFTAFVGPRHIVAGGSCHAARPDSGNERRETAPRQVKRYAVGQAAVGRFNSP